MRVAICDDNKPCRDNIYQILMKCNAMMIAKPINLFSNGMGLIEHYQKQGGFDLIFLDIEMPELSGIDTGHMIRKMDKNVMIVFLTNHEHYARPSIKIEPFDFLIKPSSLDEVSDVLGQAFKKYQDQHHILKIKQENTLTKLEINKIVYLWGYYGNVTFYTTSGEYDSIGTLNKYEINLIPYGFVRCHKNYMVNMRYIKSIEDNRILTTMEYEVEMSCRMKKECLKKLDEYFHRYEI